MLGQRILDAYPEPDADADGPTSYPTSLTVRRPRTTGLRIITESEVLCSDTSKVRRVLLILHFAAYIPFVRRMQLRNTSPTNDCLSCQLGAFLCFGISSCFECLLVGLPTLAILLAVQIPL